MTKEPQKAERNGLIADIKRLMNPLSHSQPRYSSFTANKVVDKLLIRLGIIAIVGLLGYIVIRDSIRDKKCRC